MEELMEIEQQKQRAEQEWTWRLVAASLVAGLGLLSSGSCYGYSAACIADLNNHRSPLRVTAEQQSWYFGMMLLSATVGVFVAAPLVDRLGRKGAFFAAAVPMVTGFVLVIAAINVALLYISNILCGVAMTIYINCFRVYAAEIATVGSRGVINAYLDFMLIAGVAYPLSASIGLHWNWLAVTCAATSACVAVLLMFCPESPRWLVLHGEVDAADDALRWLRGDEAVAAAELAEIREAVARSPKPVPWRSFITQRPLLKFLLMSQALFLLRQFSGNSVLFLYVVSIFESVGCQWLHPNVESAIVNAVGLTGCLMCAVAAEKFHRKTVLIVSTLGMAVANVALGVSFFLREHLVQSTWDDLSWMTLLFLSVAVVFFTFGLSSFPFMITNELFSTQARGRAHSLGVMTNYLGAFLTTKTYIVLQRSIGPAAIFWSYGGICLAGAIFVRYVLPETGGKSLEQLELELGGGSETPRNARVQEKQGSN